MIQTAMDEQNSPIFTQAKLEYTNQLIDILTPHLFDGVKSIYDEAKTVNSVNRRQSITLLFREFLEKVPSWSNVLIEGESDRIIKMSLCDWLDDLITAVFISHTKILTSIGVNTTNNSIDLVIPKITTFIHKCYINIAREMWKNPYFFTENVIASEYQKNMRSVELIIKDCIENTIRQLLPIKEILKQNLDRSEIKQDISRKNINSQDIKELLLEEIKNLNLLNILKPDKKEELLELNKTEEEGLENEKDLERKIEENIELFNNEKGNEDDYESVDEETIKKNCENLEINTLDSPEDTSENKIKEEIYDNVEIVENNDTKDKTILEKFIENLSENEDENEDEGEDEDNGHDKKWLEEEKSVNKNIIENIEDLLDYSEIKQSNYDSEKKQEPEPEPEPEPSFIEDNFDENSIVKKSEKELISVEKISDNETVDEFFNDVSKIIENKTGISVNKYPDKYVLFDDADNNE